MLSTAGEWRDFLQRGMRVKDKLFLIKSNLHTHTDEQGAHPAGYPPGQVLRFFEEEDFDLVGITDHNRDTSRRAYRSVLRNKPERIRLISGYEKAVNQQHLVTLFLPGRKRFILYCHPVRTFGADWERRLIGIGTGKNSSFLSPDRAAHRDGVDLGLELDNNIAFTPELRSVYRALRRKCPVISNSDFHANLFMLKNCFTVFIAKEPTLEGVLEAIQERNLIAFYPDFKTWTRRFLPSGGRWANAWLAKTEREAPLFQIQPRLRPGELADEDIAQYWKRRLVTLTMRRMSMSLIPEFGAALASFRYRGCHLCSPLYASHLETPAEYHSYPTFESNFNGWRILRLTSDRITMEYEIRADKRWKGLVLKRDISLLPKGLNIRLWRENRSDAQINFSPVVTFNLDKKLDERVEATVMAPGPRKACRTPLNLLERCNGRAEIRFEQPGKPRIDVACQGRGLKELRLWDSREDLRTLFCFWFEEEVILPGKRGPTHTFRICPSNKS